MLREQYLINSCFITISGTMLLVTLSVTGFGILTNYFPKLMDAKKAILQYVSKRFSLASNARVEFDWDEPIRVGKTVSFSIFVSKDKNVYGFLCSL